MTSALGRRIGTARGVFSAPLIWCRNLSSASRPLPTADKCATAAPQILLVDEADAPPKIEMAQFILQRRVLVYDGVCHLCHSGVKRIIKADKDRKIRFCCVQSKAAEPYMEVCGVEQKDVLRRFLFVESPGSYHQGSSAALRVLSHLPLPISALSSLMFVPTPLRDAVYDLVAKRRYDWFGKDDDCLVLKEVELLERFVDGEELLERIRSKQL
ncbi:hypothetical protein ACS0TY_010054 [Phlomoides rotata]